MMRKGCCINNMASRLSRSAWEKRSNIRIFEMSEMARGAAARSLRASGKIVLLAIRLDEGLEESRFMHGRVEAARPSVSTVPFPQEFEPRDALSLFDRANKRISFLGLNQSRRHSIKQQVDV